MLPWRRSHISSFFTQDSPTDSASAALAALPVLGNIHIDQYIIILIA